MTAVSIDYSIAPHINEHHYASDSFHIALEDMDKTTVGEAHIKIARANNNITVFISFIIVDNFEGKLRAAGQIPYIYRPARRLSLNCKGRGILILTKEGCLEIQKARGGGESLIFSYQA